jgi:hypothetical protein
LFCSNIRKSIASKFSLFVYIFLVTSFNMSKIAVLVMRGINLVLCNQYL